jgi:hypothetical protein
LVSFVHLTHHILYRYNAHDTQDEIQQYNHVIRHLGFGLKPNQIYFGQQDMILWRFKTFALAQDLELPELDVYSLLSDNANEKTNDEWFSPDELKRCLSLKQIDKLQIEQGKMVDALAHMCSRVYDKKEKIKGWKKKWSDEQNGFEFVKAESSLSEIGSGILTTNCKTLADPT